MSTENPFEKSKQQHEEISAMTIPENSSHYALDSHGNPIFGTSEQEVRQKTLEANQGYS